MAPANAIDKFQYGFAAVEALVRSLTVCIIGPGTLHFPRYLLARSASKRFHHGRMPGGFSPVFSSDGGYVKW